MLKSGFISIGCKVSVLRGVSVLIAATQNGQQTSLSWGSRSTAVLASPCPDKGDGNREPVAAARPEAP
jgi:hypothetical protein